MRTFAPNLIDTATITGSSQASASLGYANVAHPHKSRVWRTGTSVAAEYVTFDLGSSQAATSAIIFAHTLLAGDSLIQLRKSTDNFAANDVLVGNFTWTAAAMILTFSSASSRYWRVKFTKASAGVSRDVGRIFLGTYTDYAGLPDWDGFKVKVNDMSQTSRSDGGQTYSAQRPQFRSIKMDMSGVTAAQILTLKTLGELVGTHTPFFVQADSAATDETGELFYVKNASVPNRDADGLDATGAIAWAAPMDLEEEL